jgi:hypothetical protein
MSEREEIEAIKQLKYRYLRAVDTKDFDLLAGTFSPDAVSAYDGGNNSYEGREAIIGWLRQAMDNGIVTLHQVHHPEIELMGPETAKGTWYLEDRVINPGGDTPEMPGHSILSGTAFYADEYVKRGGEWLISLTGYERVYVDIRAFEKPKVFESRWEGRSAS